MILDDLLIHGAWLEENDIKNNLYKQFLNYLRIKLRKITDYNGNGYYWGFGDYGNRYNYYCNIDDNGTGLL